MKYPQIILSFIVILVFALVGEAQTSVGNNYNSFLTAQKSWPRPADALKRKEDTLRAQFERKGLNWPAHYIYVRSFKYDSQLEVWVKNKPSDPFKLFHTYKVCALAGSLGPKRLEGDYQVPEGFYYINEFNPKSTYHLSLGLNYPNASDKLLSDAYRPGGDIYIHGSCVTVGCIPLTDDQIEDLYILAAHAKDKGQDYIPVHIFPIRFNIPRSVEYLKRMTDRDADLKVFAKQMEDAFNYFEKHHELPVVMIDDKGDYLVDDVPPKKGEIPKNIPKHPEEPRYRKIAQLENVVHQWPQYPGGGEKFLTYLKDLGHQMAKYLPEGLPKAYILMEFVVDTDGTTTNFKILRGVSEDFDRELIAQLEKMPVWKPAILHDKPVAKLMKQSFEISVSTEE